MKSKLKSIIAISVTVMIILCGWMGVKYSIVLVGVDIPTSLSHIFNPPNTADDSFGWNLMLVNSEYYIPKDYDPPLSELANGQKVDSRIYNELQCMFMDAESEGVYMVVISGYRNPEKQREIMRNKIISYTSEGYSYSEAERLAKKWVAQEGTSEHQLGLAVDINQDPSKCSADKVYDWLNENASRYGFIKRYPSDKVDITKISNEPWHYRYVGQEAADEMKQKNLCLEEYVKALKNKQKN